MLHLCSIFLQLLLFPSFNTVGLNVSAPPHRPNKAWLFPCKRGKYASWESPLKQFCLWNTSIGVSRDEKGQFQLSPRTAGDRRMAVWLRQLNAFLGGITGLTFTSSVLNLSVLSKLNFSLLIHQVWCPFPKTPVLKKLWWWEKKYIWSLWEVCFHNKKKIYIYMIWYIFQAFKKCTKLENVTILDLKHSVPHYFFCKMKINMLREEIIYFIASLQYLWSGHATVWYFLKSSQFSGENLNNSLNKVSG